MLSSRQVMLISFIITLVICLIGYLAAPSIVGRIYKAAGNIPLPMMK